MTLLVSTDRGQTFRWTNIGPWELNDCPMSTDYLGEGGERVAAAWETAGQPKVPLEACHSQREKGACYQGLQRQRRRGTPNDSK